MPKREKNEWANQMVAVQNAIRMLSRLFPLSQQVPLCKGTAMPQGTLVARISTGINEWGFRKPAGGF